MTAPAAQWQLDRLSTSAREAAEIASLGAGVSLSSWLTKLISVTCSAEGVASLAEAPKILEFTREISRSRSIDAAYPARADADAGKHLDAADPAQRANDAARCSFPADDHAAASRRGGAADRLPPRFSRDPDAGSASRADAGADTFGRDDQRLSSAADAAHAPSACTVPADAGAAPDAGAAAASRARSYRVA